MRWNGYVTQQNGLDWVASFAAQQGKPISIPEWGLSIRTDGHGGGDNAYFVQHMHDWIVGHNVAFQMYFEFDAPDGAHRLMTNEFPIGSQTYRQLFGGAPPVTSSSTVPTTSTSTSTSTSTTTPTTTAPPPPPPITTTTPASGLVRAGVPPGGGGAAAGAAGARSWPTGSARSSSRSRRSRGRSSPG